MDLELQCSNERDKIGKSTNLEVWYPIRVSVPDQSPLWFPSTALSDFPPQSIPVCHVGCSNAKDMSSTMSESVIYVIFPSGLSFTAFYHDMTYKLVFIIHSATLARRTTYLYIHSHSPLSFSLYMRPFAATVISDKAHTLLLRKHWFRALNWTDLHLCSSLQACKQSAKIDGSPLELMFCPTQSKSS